MRIHDVIPQLLNPAIPESLHHGMARSDAVRQFEALLLEQMLRRFREAGQLWGEEEEGVSGKETYLQIAEQHLAQALAAGRGFGIARILLEKLPPPASPATDPLGASRR